jgi:hypothetical protein
MSQDVKVARKLSFTEQAGNQANIFGNPSNKKAVFVDHFVNKALNATNDYTAFIDTDSTVALGAGATATGYVTFTTLATDTRTASLAGNLAWYCARNPIMEARIKVDVITTVAINVGFNDATAEGTTALPFLITGTTITDTCTDGAMFCYDTNQTTDRWYIVQTKNGTQTGVLLGAKYTPVAATWVTLRVALDTAGNAYYYYNGEFVGRIASAVTTTVALCPYIGFKNLSAAIHIMDLDYIKLWAD